MVGDGESIPPLVADEELTESAQGGQGAPDTRRVGMLGLAALSTLPLHSEAPPDRRQHIFRLRGVLIPDTRGACPAGLLNHLGMSPEVEAGEVGARTKLPAVSRVLGIEDLSRTADRTVTGGHASRQEDLAVGQEDRGAGDP